MRLVPHSEGTNETHRGIVLWEQCTINGFVPVQRGANAASVFPALGAVTQIQADAAVYSIAVEVVIAYSTQAHTPSTFLIACQGARTMKVAERMAGFPFRGFARYLRR